jgi:hypothetical protein
MRALSRPHPGRRSGGVLLLLSAAGLLVGGTAGRAAATDPYIAGQPATIVSPVSADEAAVQIERAVQVGRRLGLPTPARRTVERVEDRRGQTSFDEVTEIDAAGRPSALLRYAPDGRLVAAVHLGWQPDRGKAVAAEADAVRLALAIARGAGFEPAGQAVPLSRGTNGWTVGWDRLVDGVPVPGDGIRVQLQADGSFHGFTWAEHPLAPAPITVLGAGIAQQSVGRLLDRWIPAPSRADVRIDGASLAWVAPNDTFEPSLPDAPADVRRLAWVVRVRSTGAFADALRGLEVAIDAGDGSLLGGDVLQ